MSRSPWVDTRSTDEPLDAWPSAGASRWSAPAVRSGAPPRASVRAAAASSAPLLRDGRFIEVYPLQGQPQPGTGPTRLDPEPSQGLVCDRRALAPSSPLLRG